MKAMVFAAGLGTRLRPLTDDRPKALVEVAGRTMLEITLSRLRAFGIREVIVNVHHFAEMVIDYLKANNNFGMRIEVSREEVLLDTGGGLKKAAYFFLEDSNSLEEPIHFAQCRCSQHDRSPAYGAISYRKSCPCHAGRAKPGELLDTFSSTNDSSFAAGDLCGMAKLKLFDLHRTLQALAFCGIHVISPNLLCDDDGRGVFLHHHVLFDPGRPRRKDPRLSGR